jgi:hypothetical protein
MELTGSDPAPQSTHESDVDVHVRPAGHCSSNRFCDLQSDKTFFIQSALLYLHHNRMNEQRREDFWYSVIIEEAHHMLRDERRSLVGGQSVMDVISTCVTGTFVSGSHEQSLYEC